MMMMMMLMMMMIIIIIIISSSSSSSSSSMEARRAGWSRGCPSPAPPAAPDRWQTVTTCDKMWQQCMHLNHNMSKCRGCVALL